MPVILLASLVLHHISTYLWVLSVWRPALRATSKWAPNAFHVLFHAQHVTHFKLPVLLAWMVISSKETYAFQIVASDFGKTHLPRLAILATEPVKSVLDH